MVIERIDLRASITEDMRREEVLLRRNAFEQAGFNPDWIDALQAVRPTLYSPLVLTDHLAGLGERKFGDPRRMVQLFPAILNLGFENIDAKLAGLKERGFVNPRKMVESSPPILGLTFENIDAKLAGLKERGFVNPRKMVESLPSIFGYTFENIDAKLAGLKERGFVNPRKMVESRPPILGYTFENIDRRLRLLSALIHLYEVPFTAQELMEKQNALFGSKIDKIVILVRILRKIAQDPQDVTSRVVKKLLFLNLEDVLVAVDMIPDDEKVNTSKFLSMVKKVKAARYTRERKRNQIKEGLQHEPKILRRYLKGYPEEKIFGQGRKKVVSSSRS